MKGAMPQLAALREAQVGTDISRGQEYGTQARALQDVYTQLENTLAEAIRNRMYQAGISGAAAEQAGLTTGSEQAIGGAQAARSQSGLTPLYGGAYTTAQENKSGYDQAMLSILDQIVSGAGGISGGTTGGGNLDLAKTLSASQKTATPQGNLTVSGTPYQSQLSSRQQQNTLAQALAKLRG
jgi:hypothetical protein